jgi:hypothetical protein
MLIRATDSALIVIDVQERLVPVMQAHARSVQNMKLLLHAARINDVPAILTEQYPKGLGPTLSEIKKAAGDSIVLSKMHFSCMEDPTFAKELNLLDADR